MRKHIVSCLWLLALTVLLCCVLYPLVLWAVGRTFFPHQAEGSLIDENGNPTTDPAKARGSLLIGQPFKGEEYFQPRPSNAGNGYDASQSGASNWSASNPLLRSRVARALGPLVKYDRTSPTKPGKAVGKDIETWFQEQEPDFIAQWAKDNSTVAEQWVKDNSDAVAAWLTQKVPAWRGKSVDDVKNNSGDAAADFWKSYAAANVDKIAWPTSKDKVIESVQKGSDVQAYLFDPWLQAKATRKALRNGDIILEQVPADMVMSSGSGLDPHITLANAHYQLPGVVDAWVKKPALAGVKGLIRQEIETLLENKTFAPLGGLAGVSMINVVEVNIALVRRMKELEKQGEGG